MAEGKRPGLLERAQARFQHLPQGLKEGANPHFCHAQSHHCLDPHPQPSWSQIPSPYGRVVETHKHRGQSDPADCNYLSPQVLAALGIDATSLHSHNGSPLAPKNANERRPRVKSRMSESSTDDNRSPQSDPYNQRRMVRRAELARRFTLLCSCCGHKELGMGRGGDLVTQTNTPPHWWPKLGQQYSWGGGLMMRTFLCGGDQG